MKNKYHLIYIAMATILFSSMEVAIKSTNKAFNPIQLNFIRFFIGGLILLPLAMKKLKKHSYSLKKSDYIKFMISGFCSVVVSMSFYTSSIAYIPAYTAAIIFACNTFFSIIFAFLLMKENISKLSMFALAIALFGMMVIINPFNFKGDITGVMLCLMAAISFALYSVLGKYFSKSSPIGGIVITSFGFLFGVAELFIVILLSHIEAVSDFFLSKNLSVFSKIPIFEGINTSNLTILAFIAIGVTGIGFASYFLAIENLPMTMVSLVFFLKPILAPIIAFIFLNEIISIRNIYGLSLIAIGSSLLFISNLKSAS